MGQELRLFLLNFVENPIAEFCFVDRIFARSKSHYADVDARAKRVARETCCAHLRGDQTDRPDGFNRWARSKRIRGAGVFGHGAALGAASQQGDYECNDDK